MQVRWQETFATQPSQWAGEQRQTGRTKKKSALEGERTYLMNKAHWSFPRRRAEALSGILASGSPYLPPPSRLSASGLPCGVRPQSQWRGRAGFSPASLFLMIAILFASSLSVKRCVLMVIVSQIVGLVFGHKPLCLEFAQERCPLVEEAA